MNEKMTLVLAILIAILLFCLLCSNTSALSLPPIELQKMLGNAMVTIVK